MQLKTILNRVQKLKSFAYGKVRWEEINGQESLLIELFPRRNSPPICSRCRRPGEARRMKDKGLDPILKHSRWRLLKRPENLTEKKGIKLADLLWFNLKTKIPRRGLAHHRRFGPGAMDIQESREVYEIFAECHLIGALILASNR